MLSISILQVLLICLKHASAASLSNVKTSLTLLYQNNLNATDDINHVGFILLDPFNQKDASAACTAVGEALISKATLQAHKLDFVHSLSYAEYAGRVAPSQSYFIENGVVTVSGPLNTLTILPINSRNAKLPVLCTQSSTSPGSTSKQVEVESTGNTFVGYRDQKSFRFLGIRYAEPPKRFDYSVAYAGKGEVVSATTYGAPCTSAEDCLFLNIQTPYIPKQGSTKELRPVLFWIHGGGFVNGEGSDPMSDGDNLASREDIVVVTINYRLGAFGFLAVPGTNIRGNFGIADQINALEWTIKNIASFGGDPKKITISGESAGAGSVRTLLGSPPAKGKFQAAVAMSNLGGGIGLGLSGNYATTYSSYLTIEEAYARGGKDLFVRAGCAQPSVDAQIACLKQVPAATLRGLSNNARFVVQDGHYVNTEQLDLVNGTAAHVPVVFGITADDGASFITYPKTPVTSHLQGIQTAMGIAAVHAQSIIDSGLFPLYDTGNLTLDSFNVSSRVITDNGFRCIDQATVYTAAKTGAFPASYYYQMERTALAWDPNNLGGPPPSPGYPNGNPNLPYFKLHGNDMPWLFGNLQLLRDDNDLYSIQLTTAYFGAFVKTGQPNPPERYLHARGYESALKAVKETGPWRPVGDERGPIRLLDYPSTASAFIDVPQCAFLNYSLSYYLEGGS